ncbi:ABC transporter ATP-binding protein [Ectothiorhodospiraceae bacterium BW-2]|nr:ABC transporter ATP-binding protein [Ectothiorhodospiraceae bacterium BW-2]
MIELQQVSKRYITAKGPGPWVLDDITLTIPAQVNVGLIGHNGAGKSTLLRLIGGLEQPNQGKIVRNCRISWPLGFGGGLHPKLSGHQNAKFLCRVHGVEQSMADVLQQIQDFSEIGKSFYEPVSTYSSGMKARLTFALSLAFDFDVYLSDEMTAVGDKAFKQKAKQAFEDLMGRSSLIMVSHAEEQLKEFCQAGIFLFQGKVLWFDRVEDALEAYNSCIEAKNRAKKVG